MEAALLYLLKANAVLALFATAYYGLLRRLTFFQLNRAFLLLALLFAAVYPALPMPGLLPAEAPAPTGPPAAWLLADAATATAAAAQPAASGPDWVAIGLGAYALGAGLLLARLLVQLLALARLRRTARPATTLGGVPYRQLPAPGDPFSFGRTIYLHAAQYSATELAVVLAHEQAHISQRHTPDVLLAHLGTALFWVNPAAWLLRRALLDNLEYLADAATLRTGLDRRAYQYCLLRLSRGPVGPALALPFTFLTLKNRVAMMNTPLSARGQLARYVLAGPLVMLMALGYSAAHARTDGPVVGATAGLAKPAAGVPRAPAAPASPPAVRLPTPTKETRQSAALGLQPTVRPAAAGVAKLPKAPPMASPPVATRSVQTGLAPRYYLDGQTITEAQYKAIKSADVASIYILKGEQARQLAGDAGDNGIVIITSEANKNNWSVIQFNRRVQRISPAAMADASATAKHMPTDALYYLDGQPSTWQAIEQVEMANIADMDVIREQASIHRLPGAATSTAPAAIVVTTKANIDAPIVRAFADEAGLASAYFLRPVGASVLRPAALAYITSHYPDARIHEVYEQKRKTTGEVKYRVWLANGKRPFSVYFTPQGEFISE